MPSSTSPRIIHYHLIDDNSCTSRCGTFEPFRPSRVCAGLPRTRVFTLVCNTVFTCYRYYLMVITFPQSPGLQNFYFYPLRGVDHETPNSELVPWCPTLRFHLGALLRTCRCANNEHPRSHYSGRG